MTAPTDRSGGFDEWLDALEAGAGYYLACPEGHGSLPPRRACPACGATDLDERALPDDGRIETYTVVHVATPAFAEDVPYVTAIASFGPVRVTGILRGIDSTDVSIGTTVGIAIEETETAGDRVLCFRPR